MYRGRKRKAQIQPFLETTSGAYIWYYVHFIHQVPFQQILHIKLTFFEGFPTRG